MAGLAQDIYMASKFTEISTKLQGMMDSHSLDEHAGARSVLVHYGLFFVVVVGFFLLQNTDLHRLHKGKLYEICRQTSECFPPKVPRSISSSVKDS